MMRGNTRENEKGTTRAPLFTSSAASPVQPKIAASALVKSPTSPGFIDADMSRDSWGNAEPQCTLTNVNRHKLFLGRTRDRERMPLHQAQLWAIEQDVLTCDDVHPFPFELDFDHSRGVLNHRRDPSALQGTIFAERSLEEQHDEGHCEVSPDDTNHVPRAERRSVRPGAVIRVSQHP